LNGLDQNGSRTDAMQMNTGSQRTVEKTGALRRQHERRSAAIKALVQSHGRYQTISIVDFSAGGVQMQGAFGVTTGDQIVIELLSGHKLNAKVAWSLGSRIGAQFAQALTPDSPALLSLQSAATAGRDR
jgi:hypothetical protein